MFSCKIPKSTFDAIGDYWLSLTAIVQALIMQIQLLLGDGGFLDKEYVALLRVILSGFIVLGSLPWIIYRSPKLFVASYLLSISLLAFSIVLNPNNTPFVLSEGLRFTLCICLPVFLCVSSIQSIHIFKIVCYRISVLCALFGILYGALFVTQNLSMLEDFYNMSYGYALLFPAMFFVYKGGAINMICSFVLFVLIFLCGSRGPLIPYLLYLLWMKCFMGSKTNKMLFLVFFISLILLFPLLLSLLDNWGIDSRTVYLLLNGEAGNNSGRDELSYVTINKIFESPYWGYGVFGDRFFLDNGYCHNLFLELCVDYGIFIALLIALCAFFLIVKCLLVQDRDFRNIFMLFVLISICPLMVSNSYLIEFRLYVLLGMILNACKNKWFHLNNCYI